MTSRRRDSHRSESWRMVISLGIAGVVILLFASVTLVVPPWGLVVLVVFAVIYAVAAAREVRRLERLRRERGAIRHGTRSWRARGRSSGSE